MIKTLPKEKRERLLLVAVGTAAVCAGIWFGLVKTQNRALVNMARMSQEQQAKIDNATHLIDGSAHVARRLEAFSQKIVLCEETMASSDMYSWLVLTINKFKAPYRVDIPQLSREVPCEV